MDIKEKLDRYIKITEEALEKVKIAEHISVDQDTAKEILKMARRYYQDALHFKEKGDYLNALAAISYAHGWLDTAAYIGLFNVNDSRLFTVD